MKRKHVGFTIVYLCCFFNLIILIGFFKLSKNNEDVKNRNQNIFLREISTLALS
jgi:hypothetical protein